MTLTPQLDPRTGRLTVATVREMERLLGGDPVTEAEIIRFIAARYGAPNLLRLPIKVAAAILDRPANFIRAAKAHSHPELAF